MSDSSVFKGNLEVETIHMLVFGLTTFFVFIGLTVDILTEQNMVLWLIFLATSFFLFITGFIAKYSPKAVIFIALSSLVFISIYSISNLYMIAGEVLYPQIITLIAYVLTMIVINVLTFNTLSSGNVVDLSMKKRKTSKMSTYSKLRRRNTRRNSSRSNTSTHVRSGAYRG